MVEDNERGRLASGLERHVVEEEEILGQYRGLAGVLKDGPAGLLIRLIFRDEEQHHLLLTEIAKDLKAALDERPLPSIDESAGELREMISRLMEHEEATIENCRKLKPQFAAQELGLFAAMLDAVIADSEKHRRLLLALDGMLKSQREIGTARA